MFSRTRSIVALAAMTALTAGALAACSTDEPAGHNDADVTFSTEMLPHHRQAVEMAELVPSRSSDPEVVTLARQITDGQQPEIDQLTTRLRSWDEPVPSDDMDHAGGDHGSMDHGGMSGMMTDADMTRLRTLSGAAFDRRWLTMMIEHHTGAVAMARTEIADGVDPDSIALARTIVATQDAELARMRAMLAD